jgi:CRP/FNR family transcriptional regulator, anaerobic regulatory protein
LDCASCPPHRVNLIHDLSDKEGARLIQFFRLRTYAVRETIHCEGDLGTHVAVIRSGLVKLMLYSPSGRERIVRLAMPGDTIGLESILGGRLHHNAVALTTAQLCCIPRDIVDRRANDHPEFARRLMAEWNASVEDAERFLTDLSTGTAHERVARLLLYLQERVGIGPCPEITREDMAALLGITMETTSRVIAEFKRDGHLREDAQGQWHCRHAGLAVIAGGCGAEGKSP